MGLAPGQAPLQLVCFMDGMSDAGCSLPIRLPQPAPGKHGAVTGGHLLSAPPALQKGAEGGPLEKNSPRRTLGVPGCTVPAALVDVHRALTPDCHPVDTGDPAPSAARGAQSPGSPWPSGPGGAQRGLLGSGVYLPLLLPPPAGAAGPYLPRVSSQAPGVDPTGSQPRSACPINIHLRLLQR